MSERPLHPLALEAWGCLRRQGAKLVLPEVDRARLRAAWIELDPQELGPAVLSFITNVGELRLLEEREAWLGMLDILAAAGPLLTLDLDQAADLAEGKDRLHDITGEALNRRAPLHGAPPPIGTVLLRTLADPLRSIQRSRRA